MSNYGKERNKLINDFLPNSEALNVPRGSKLDEIEFCRLVYNKIFENNQEDLDSEFNIDTSSLFLMQRKKLKDINTLEQSIDLIMKSQNIIVLTGAGCSVSCGIPDFRSKDGIYARLKLDFPDLLDPQSIFDIFYFESDPRPFFKFAREIFPGQFEPSLSHKFIKKLEDHGKLLRNYTQNIDTLELEAKIKNVIQCHGKYFFNIIQDFYFITKRKYLSQNTKLSATSVLLNIFYYTYRKTFFFTQGFLKKFKVN